MKFTSRFTIIALLSYFNFQLSVALSVSHGSLDKMISKTTTFQKRDEDHVINYMNRYPDSDHRDDPSIPEIVQSLDADGSVAETFTGEVEPTDFRA